MRTIDRADTPESPYMSAHPPAIPRNTHRHICMSLYVCLWKTDIIGPGARVTGSYEGQDQVQSSKRAASTLTCKVISLAHVLSFLNFSWTH
ncbi:rCG20760 [Rattus norvegicus]|uniref:RCG20760 n=1 Tax=Rattus norvegicus TaxID=10116 RepID=A6JEB4_RAT|nr:rCG20760 [Rattus norvegicus]